MSCLVRRLSVIGNNTASVLSEEYELIMNRNRMRHRVFALLLLMRTSAASDDLPEIGPCDVALEQMEAVLVARVDGVTLQEYAESHSADMLVVATAIYKARDPAAEIQRRYEECLREQ